jgi:hypothetical protein
LYVCCCCVCFAHMLVRGISNPLTVQNPCMHALTKRDMLLSFYILTSYHSYTQIINILLCPITTGAALLALMPKVPPRATPYGRCSNIWIDLFYNVAKCHQWHEKRKAAESSTLFRKHRRQAHKNTIDSEFHPPRCGTNCPTPLATPTTMTRWHQDLVSGFGVTLH